MLSLTTKGLSAAALAFLAGLLLTGCSAKGPGDDLTIDPETIGTTPSVPLAVTATGSLTEIIDQTAHLSLLKAALSRAGLTETIKVGSLTFFAPSDNAFREAGYSSREAFDKLPPAELKRLLQYHLLNGRLSSAAVPAGAPVYFPTALPTASVALFRAFDGKMYANASPIGQQDIGASSSVMYVVEKLMTVPSQNTTSLIKANPELSLFNAAIERVGSAVATALLSPTERGITVFAPSNAAFRAAGFADVDAVSGADKERLTAILRYHILPAQAFSPMLRPGDQPTLQGTALSVNVGPKGVTVTGKGNPGAAGNLLQTDLGSTTGVIHVIDRMLLPQAVSQ